MLSTLVAITALAGSATAHFRLNQPTWRGDSFAAPASQWQYPCANINATTDAANRTQWPLNGGSVVFNGSHPWSMTYVNLALGSAGSSFNITLVPGFNQTGPGVFCFKVNISSRTNLARNQMTDDVYSKLAAPISMKASRQPVTVVSETSA
jgi:hypothetical protein